MSSFSFESDHGTGLREELRIDGREDSVVSIEYSFRDDSPLLSIALEIQFPELPLGAAVDEYAPLALPLRLLKRGESATIEIAAPDGSTSSVEVSEEQGASLPRGPSTGSGGARWLDRPGLLDTRRIRVGPALVQRHQEPRTRVLEATRSGKLHPPSPGRTASGRHECFSLRLGLEDA